MITVELKTKIMIQLEEKFDGHIILYCKSYYNIKMLILL